MSEKTRKLKKKKKKHAQKAEDQNAICIRGVTSHERIWRRARLNFVVIIHSLSTLMFEDAMPILGYTQHFFIKGLFVPQTMSYKGGTRVTSQQFTEDSPAVWYLMSDIQIECDVLHWIRDFFPHSSLDIFPMSQNIDTTVEIET